MANFTLIELLIAIAIIEILAALFLPASGKAKEQTRRIHCMNNMKQIQLGLNIYILDYDGYLPPHLRSFYATDREKWRDIAATRFMASRDLGRLFGLEHQRFPLRRK